MSSVRKHASVATIAVLGSRMTGLVREIIFAFFFGASPALDAFIAAFRIPNLLRDLFSEGALSNAFVTVFSKKYSKEGAQAGWDLSRRVLTFVIVFVGGISLLGIIFSPWVVKAVAPGFTGEKLALTIELNRILFPFILFISLAAITMGMLNTLGQYALPQSASTFFNVSSVLMGLGIAYWLAPHAISFSSHKVHVQLTWDEMSRAMIGMALGTLFGGLIQWIIHIPHLRQAGFRLKPLFSLKDPGLRQVLLLTIPAVIGGAAVQVNVLVNTNFASYLADGSMAWLNYAFRLMQFPIGVFGVAIALATTPTISRFFGQNDHEGFKTTLRDSTQLALFLCIPSALGLMALAKPIIALIYQHGHFSPNDTLQASYALTAYALGLSFYSIIKIYQPAFLALNDARTPMIVSLCSIIINFVFNWFFVKYLHLAHWGLALGTSIVAGWNGIMLLTLLRKKMPGVWTKTLYAEITKILGSALLSVFIGRLAYQQILSYLGDSGLIKQAILVFIPIGFTVILYVLVCYLLKVQEVTLLKGFIQRKFAKTSV